MVAPAGTQVVRKYIIEANSSEWVCCQSQTWWEILPSWNQPIKILLCSFLKGIQWSIQNQGHYCLVLFMLLFVASNKKQLYAHVKSWFIGKMLSLFLEIQGQKVKLNNKVAVFYKKHSFLPMPCFSLSVGAFLSLFIQFTCALKWPHPSCKIVLSSSCHYQQLGERDKTGGVGGMAGRTWISMAELMSQSLTWFTLLCSWPWS